MTDHYTSEVYEITYWRNDGEAGRVACDSSVATEAVVTVAGSPEYPQFPFVVEQGESVALDEFVIALARAFTNGQRSWAARMRGVIEGPA